MDSLEFVYCLATLRIYIFFTVASAIIVVSGLCYKYIPEVYEIINVRGEHRLDMARWFMLGRVGNPLHFWVRFILLQKSD